MPSKPASFILYHTDVCHLCELAMALIDKTGIEYIKSDICDDSELAEQYGTRIPVLTLCNTNIELDWPFDSDALDNFFRSFT